MKLIPNIGKETKQRMLGGIVGGLIYNMEAVANILVPNYPQVLKDKLNPNLPRNGQLLSTAAPVAVAWAVTKKRTSTRANNLKMGLTLFDLPKLMQETIVTMAFQAGIPKVRLATAPIRVNNQQIRVNNSTNSVARSGTGKYTMKVSPVVGMSGVGRYKIAS